jgi:propionyl-CoA synthetase
LATDRVFVQVRDTGGHAVGLHYSAKHMFDIQPGRTWWAASDLGWVVGHSFIVYGPLLRGATTVERRERDRRADTSIQVLYEGKPVGTPDPGAFWRVIKQHEVAGFFTAPTAIRAIKKEDSEGGASHSARLVCTALTPPAGKYLAKYAPLKSLQALFLAGERADADTIQVSSVLKCSV